MSNISFDIEAARRGLAELRVRFPPSSVDSKLVDDALSTITSLTMENEQLKAKLLESGEGANAVDRELGKVMRERDEALSKLAAMQEDIVEAVRREDERKAHWPGPYHPYITAPLRRHLLTPKPLNQHDRSKPSDLEKRFKMYQSIAHARHNETMRVAELIAQAVCEAESDEALDALVDLARKVLKI